MGPVAVTAGESSVVVVEAVKRAENKAELDKIKLAVEQSGDTITIHWEGDERASVRGMLEPTIKETYQGRAQVKETFRIPRVGTIAGCSVTDGLIKRDSEVRLLRDNTVVFTGKVGSLRRFKDDASEVRNGMECGISISNYGDIKVGDVIEAFVTEKVAAEAMA